MIGVLCAYVYVNIYILSPYCLDLQECSADKKDDDDDDTGKIVGIVVGSVVGGLILLTMIGCLIQKARKRGSYEKV